MLIRLAVLSLFLAAPAFAQETRPLTFDENRRDYFLYRPADAAPDEKLPAVVVLHAAATSRRATFDRLHLKAGADAGRVVMIVPEARSREPFEVPNQRKNPQMWNDGAGRGRQAMIGLDDVAYLDAVLDDALAKGGIDARRIMVTGFGMGGSMALRYGAERGARVAAVGSVAGRLWVEPKAAVPVLLIAGEADPFLQIDGAAEIRPVRPALARWADVAGCGTTPAETKPAATVTRLDWTGCKDGAFLSLVTVAELGSQWPGGEQTKLRHLGPYSAAIDATAAMVQFLRDHGRPAS